MKYGFDEKSIKIKENDYIFGASKLPNVIFNETGQWETPTYEPQADKYETWGCTVWGSQNQIEIFFKKVFGFEPNYSEAFTYRFSDIKEGGADPQNAYESIRHNGVIDNALLSLPDTLEELRTLDISQSLIDKGEEWLLRYEFKHEWLIKPSKELIKNQLRCSPIAIAVTAWYEENGLYVDYGQPNTHWCVAFGYIEDARGLILKVFDSYDHSVKLLHPNHFISIAKGIYVGVIAQRKKNWIQNLWDFFLDIINPDRLRTGGLARSPKWGTVRKQFLLENPECAVCGKKSTLLSTNEIHHCIPFSQKPALELEKSNLITLCREHHFEFGHCSLSWKCYNERMMETINLIADVKNKARKQLQK